MAPGGYGGSGTCFAPGKEIEMKNAWFFTLLLIFFATTAIAGTCAERAQLSDTGLQYKWTKEKPAIKVWESPDMIRVVGTVKPGSDVEVVKRSHGFVKIKTSREEEAATGWVSERQVELYRNTGADVEECGL